MAEQESESENSGNESSDSEDDEMEGHEMHEEMNDGAAREGETMRERKKREKLLRREKVGWGELKWLSEEEIERHVKEFCEKGLIRDLDGNVANTFRAIL